VPWLAAVDRGRSLAGAIAAGLAMSVGFALAVFGWLADGIGAYTGASPATSYAVLAALAPILEPQLVALAAARFALRRAREEEPTFSLRREAVAAVGGALAYVAVEWAWPKPLGDSLGHGFIASRVLRQGADLAGAGGLVLVLVLANGFAVGALRAALARRTRAAFALAAAPAAAVALLWLYGEWRLAALDARARGLPPGSSITAALVQSDVASYGPLAAEVGTYEAVRRILDAHFALSADAIASTGGIDLLVWPETVYPTTFGAPKSPDGGAFDREIERFAAASGIPLVFGAYDVDAGTEYNAAFFLAPASDEPARRLDLDAYRKRALFPLTESVPSFLDRDDVRAAWPWLGTWKPGDGPAVVSVRLAGGRTIRIAPLICYDAVQPAFGRAAARERAQLFVTLSNDSWFATGAGPLQHLVVAAFRSIETHRPQLRATTTGISAVIDETGEIVASAPVHERATVIAPVAIGNGDGPWTLFVALGDWLGPVSALACTGLLVGAALARSRARPRSVAVGAPRVRARSGRPRSR